MAEKPVEARFMEKTSDDLTDRIAALEAEGYTTTATQEWVGADDSVLSASQAEDMAYELITALEQDVELIDMWKESAQIFERGYHANYAIGAARLKLAEQKIDTERRFTEQYIDRVNELKQRVRELEAKWRLAEKEISEHYAKEAAASSDELMVSYFLGAEHGKDRAKERIAELEAALAAEKAWTKKLERDLETA